MAALNLMTEIDIFNIVEKIGELIDLFGVLIILVGMITATIGYLRRYFAKHDTHQNYRLYRHSLARAILLGLEFLVAGDIIRTVAGTPTFMSILVLGMIVLIRSFLSMEFQLEIEGRFPWQRKAKP